MTVSWDQDKHKNRGNKTGVRCYSRFEARAGIRGGLVCLRIKPHETRAISPPCVLDDSTASRGDSCVIE